MTSIVENYVQGNQSIDQLFWSRSVLEIWAYIGIFINW